MNPSNNPNPSAENLSGPELGGAVREPLIYSPPTPVELSSKQAGLINDDANKRRGLRIGKRPLLMAVLAVVITAFGGTYLLEKYYHGGDLAKGGKNLPSQSVTLQAGLSDISPIVLDSSADTLVVNGNLYSHGDVRFYGTQYFVDLQPANLTANRTYQLPDSSGTLCLSSNNCSYVTANQLVTVNNQIVQLNSQLTSVQGQAAVTSINGLNGSVTLQGTANQISVSTIGNGLTIGTPQDIGINSAPSFQSINLSNGLFFRFGGGGSVGLQATDPIGSTHVITLPAASGTVCLTSGNCAGVGGTGDILNNGNSFGSAVTIGTNDNFGLNFETNNTTIASFSNSGAALFKNASNSAAAFQIQNTAGSSNLFIADTSATRIAIAKASASYTLDVGGDINTTGVYRVNGAQISSTNLSNDANLAKLDGTGPQTFTGNNKFTGTVLAQVTNASAFQVQNVGGNEVLTVDTSGTKVVLGKASTLSGNLQFQSAAGAGSISLVPNNPGASNFSLNLPAENGTLCSTGSICTGYASSSGSGNYIQNQNSVDQTADFRISGTGRANTALQAPILDTATAVALGIGNVNATVINLNQNVSIAAGKNLSYVSGAGNFDQSASSGTFATSTGTVSLNGNTTVATDKSFTALGNSLFKDATNSTTAFQVQNAAGTSLLNVDTTNSIIAVQNGASLNQTYLAATYKGGGDASGGTNTGSSSSGFNGISSVGKYLYATKNQNSTDCSNSNKVGCELQIWDASNPSSLTFVGGADSTGATNSGTGSVDNFNKSYVVSKYDYVVKDGNTTACSGTAGSAIGCEFQIYDISNPSSPTYVGGADNGGTTNSGNSGSTAGSTDVFVAGRYAYVAKQQSATACSGTAGNAEGCEIQIYDVSNPATPTYVAGIDASGQTNTGTGSSTPVSLFMAGRYLYVAKSANSTDCNTGGNRIGCEFQIYDISNPLNPSFVGGADITGTNNNNSGTGVENARNITVSGRYAYLGKVGNVTTCSSVAGSAIGCEMQVYDVSNPASLTYVAGVDQSGTTNSGGTAGDTDNFNLIQISGRYAFVGKDGYSGAACSATAGSARGCELQVYDISNPASPVYKGGVDISGQANTGSGGATGYTTMAFSGRNAYLLKGGSATACAGTVGNAEGCELQAYDLSGIETTSISTGSLETGSLQVNADSKINANFSIVGNLNVGSGLQVNGDIGTSGRVLLQNATNSTTAFQVQNATGANLLDINTLTVGFNLVANPSMEQSANGWVLRNVAGSPTVGSSDDFANFGLRSLKIVTSTGNGNGAEYRYSFAASTQYTLSLYARRDASSAASFNIGRADNGTDTDCLTNQTLNTTWTQFSCTFTTGATMGTTSNFYIKQTDTTTDNIYIDGVTLVTGATALAYVEPATAIQVDPGLSNISLNNLDSGELQPWNTNANTLPAQRYAGASATANGYIYYLGGWAGGATTTSWYAKLNSDGTTGTWQSTTSLPEAVDSGIAVVANGYIYSIGGATSSPSNVYYAKLNADGTLGTWRTSLNALPQFRARHSAVVANGYIYVIGGFDAGAVYQSTVYYAKLNADGSTGAWQSANAMPGTKGIFGAVTANGYVYVIGGYNNSYLNSVFYAKLNNDGTLGTWTNQATNLLPQNRGFLTTVTANGYVYALGGTNSGSALSSVVYARLNSDGSTGTWRTSTYSMPLGRSFHSTVTTNGYIYVLAGYITGSGDYATTVYYTSTARLKLAGSLDLVGLSGQSLADPGNQGLGSTAGSITAGDITSVGNLQVMGQGSFSQNLSALGNLAIGGSAYFQNSTNSTTAFQVQNAAAANIFNIDTSTTSNLITNGDIEGAGTAGWNHKGGASTITQVTTQQWQGNSSLQVTTTTAANEGAVYAYTFGATTQYTLSLYAKVSSGSITDVNIGRQDNGSDIDCLTGRTLTTSWTRFSCTFTTGGTINASNIYIKKTGASAETFFIDGIQLQTGASTTAFNAGGALQLGGIVNSPIAFQNKSNSTTAFQIQNAAGNSVLAVDTISRNVDVGLVNGSISLTTSGGSRPALIFWDPNGNGRSEINQLATTGGLVFCTGQFNACSNHITLSNIGAVLFQNSTDSSTAFQIQNAAGTTTLLAVDTTNLKITSKSDVVASNVATATTATTSGTGTNTTTVTLTGSAFANGDVIFIDNAGQDYYTRITAGGGTASLTVSPAVTFETGRTVTKYTIQNIGATVSDYTTQANRFFQGYFLGGVVTGAGSTIYSDSNINSINAFTIMAPSINLQRTSDSTTAFQVQNAAGTSLLTVDTSGSAFNVAANNSLFKNITNSSTAFRLQNAAGTSALAGDTTTNTITIANLVVNGSCTGCSTGGASGDLQTAYNNSSSPATISLADAKNLVFTAADSSTDPNVIVNLQCVTSCGSNGVFAVQSGGTNAFVVSPNGGSALFQNASNSGSAFRIQTSGGSNLLMADTTNSRIYVGDSSADSTGIVLVLDTKNTSGDPTGVNGAMYYNSNTGSFRCYIAGSWRDCLNAARTAYFYSNDTVNAFTDSGFTINCFGTGCANSSTAVTSVAGHPGVVQSQTGTATTGQAGTWVGPIGGSWLLLGNGDVWSGETVLRIPTLSDGTNTFIVRSGFSDINTFDSTDGCYFKYGSAVNSGKWQGYCASNTTSSTCDTTITVAANTWYRLTVVVNAAGTSADFYTDGVSRCSITTNIPTGAGRGTGFGNNIEKSAGTTSRNLDVDYIEVRGEFGTPR